jgi:hypothetical protein
VQGLAQEKVGPLPFLFEELDADVFQRRCVATQLGGNVMILVRTFPDVGAKNFLLICVKMWFGNSFFSF